MESEAEVRGPRALPGPRGPGGGGGEGEDPQLTHWGLPMVALVVGAFMALLDVSIVNVAIPTMEHVFSVNTAQVEWVVTIYLLALGVIVPTSGWLGDRMGFKRLYLYSLMAFTFGSALAALSPTLQFLIGARIIQALGGGMIMPVTMAMVYRIIPRKQIGVATGFFGLSMLLAPAFGPTLGGYLVEFVNWRWIFTINLPIGVVGTIIAASVLPEFARHEAGPFDAFGFITASTGLFTLLLGLSEGPSWGWSSEPITWLFFAAGVSLLTFIWIELTVERPLLDLRVFRYTQYTMSILFVVGINIALFSTLFFIPVYLQLVRGMGALATGLVLMPGALCSGILMPIAGRLYDRIGPRLPVVVGTLVLAGSTWLFHALSLSTPDRTIGLWVGLRGLGMGLAMMPATTAGMAILPPAMVGRASAVQNIVQRVAGSFGIAALTVVLDNGIAQQSALARAAYTPGSSSALLLLQIPAHLAAAGMSAVAAAATVYQAIYGYIAQLAFTRSIDSLFVVLAGLALLTVVPALFMRHGAQHGQREERAPTAMAAD